MNAKTTLIAAAILIAAVLTRPAIALTHVRHVPAVYPTIQSAIDAANAADRVQIAAGVYRETIDLRGKKIELRGNENGGTIIDATGLGGSVITCVSGETDETRLRYLTITGGTGSPSPDGSGRIVGGGMLIHYSAPGVYECRFVGNSAQDRGGAIYGFASSAVITGSTFSHNEADRGGAISLEGAGSEDGIVCYFTLSPKTKIDRCTFHENRATEGGAIANQCAPFEIGVSWFYKNEAALGGAISNRSDDSEIENCEFYENRAGAGGAIYLHVAPEFLCECGFYWNSATDPGAGGGAMLVDGQDAELLRCTFWGNRAAGTGGAIFAPVHSAGATECTFYGNGPNHVDGSFGHDGNVFGSRCPMPRGVEDGAQLGRCIAAIGDVDDDGFADFAAGAPYHGYDPLHADKAGRVEVYSGRSWALIYSLDGAAHGDRLGWSIARLGDVDGDGAGDFVVGAPMNDDNGTNAGRASVYSGATGVRLMTRRGLAAGDRLGWAVGGGCDVDGDGTKDILIASPRHDGPAGANAGRVDVWSGAMHTRIGVLHGEGSGDWFGTAVAGLRKGDTSGAGGVVIGAPRNDDRDVDAGKVYLHAGPQLTLRLIRRGPRRGDRFGAAVARAGSLDGDNVHDFIVGAPRSDRPGLPNAGRADVFSGATGTRLWFVRGLEAGGRLGAAVSAMPDLDGDGVRDVLIGAPKVDPANGGGRPVFVRSGVNGSEILSLVWLNGETGSDLGAAVAGLPDMDGDGRGEILTGWPQPDDEAGRVWISLSSVLLPTAAAQQNLAGDRSPFGDETDLMDLVGSWGDCEDCPSDLDGDGDVDADDLLLLANES